MKLIKQLETNRLRAAAQTVTYKNVSFPHGFGPFLAALEIGRIAAEVNRQQVSEGCLRWVDEAGNGGIDLFTTKHPYITMQDYNQFAGDVTIVGDPDKLALVESLLRGQGVAYEGATEPEDVELTHEYHDELNPEIWDGKTMIPEVRDQLLKTAEAFVEFLKIEDLDVEDIILTGSSANYNWTDASDIDVHIVVDFERAISKHGDLVEEYFNAKKNVFNNLHDIKIRGNTVELYVQDSNEQHIATGIFSLQNNKWEIEPEHKQPSVDDSAVRAKTAEMMNAIDDVANNCYKAAPVEALMEKLKKMRQAGLERAGEFSVENLVFKQLRHTGYLEKLSTCKTRSFDRELSIEEEEWSHLC